MMSRGDVALKAQNYLSVDELLMRAKLLAQCRGELHRELLVGNHACATCVAELDAIPAVTFNLTW